MELLLPLTKSGFGPAPDRNFDLILLDVSMPGIDGFEVLKIVRQKHTLVELPVILVTALDASSDVTTALSSVPMIT